MLTAYKKCHNHLKFKIYLDTYDSFCSCEVGQKQLNHALMKGRYLQAVGKKFYKNDQSLLGIQVNRRKQHWMNMTTLEEMASQKQRIL